MLHARQYREPKQKRNASDTYADIQRQQFTIMPCNGTFATCRSAGCQAAVLTSVLFVSLCNNSKLRPSLWEDFHELRGIGMSTYNGPARD